MDQAMYRRGAETAVASWEAYARGSPGAAVIRTAGVVAAVFPFEPERTVYNNAILETGLDRSQRANAINAMEAAYAAGSVDRFAAWVHESDVALSQDLEDRGYRIDTTTRAMGMSMGELRTPRPELDLAPATWTGYLEFLRQDDDVPDGLLAGVDPTEFRLLLARVDGEVVAAGLAFDFDGDCGVYNIGTLEHARRRGIGTAVTALLVHDAAARGCRTASLQSTAMAEQVYANVGFRDLGRIVEYVPAP